MSDVRAELHDTLLYLDGVTVSFDGFRALNALSLVLEAGEMRAVIGPNGAGKTTMMDVITGKTRPDEGKVVFGKDTDLTRLDEPAIASLGIGRKFQKPTVFEPHTVWDNLLLSLAEDRRPRFTLWAHETRGGARTHRGDPGHHASDRPAPSSGGRTVARAKTVAGDRHAAGAGAAASSGR